MAVFRGCPCCLGPSAMARFIILYFLVMCHRAGGGERGGVFPLAGGAGNFLWGTRSLLCPGFSLS